MAASGDSVHVLLLSYPAQGHINPLLQFGKRLAAGHRGAVRCTLAVARSALVTGEPHPSEIHLATFSDGCDTSGYNEVGDVQAYLDRLETAGSRTLDELLRAESAEGRPVRVVVYDAFLLWAPRVARHHGASCAAFFTQACAVNVAYAHALAGKVDLPLAEVPAELPGLPKGLEPADFSTFLTEQPTGSSSYRELLLQQCQGLEVADHALINSFYELQTEVTSDLTFLRSRVRDIWLYMKGARNVQILQEADYLASRWGAKTVGPTLPSAYLDNRIPDDSSYNYHLHSPMTAECKAWLDNRPAHSVVYVSFGSLVAIGPDQMAELAEGLCNSEKAFLWVVRNSEISKLPESFVSKAKDRGLIVSWSQQLEVLAHPAIGCFMTHCGWNSTIEGLGIGVPMVAMPQWSDQPMNAKYMEDVWKVGVRVRLDANGVVRKEEVERCVRAVMEGEMREEYRKNAMGWKEKSKTALSEGGSSDRNIMEFLGNFGLNI
ncbi:hypothetical protein EJB05_22471, partial [Eragrostis curvula]